MASVIRSIPLVPTLQLVPTLALIAAAGFCPELRAGEAESTRVPAPAASPASPSTSTSTSTSTSANIIVTADRAPSDLGRTTATVDVVSRDDLRQIGTPVQAIDAIATLPGVEVSRTGGGLAGATTVRMRGGDTHDTAILLDGIPLHDPTATQSQPNTVLLTGGGLERIEVVKGAQSGLYGSSAIAGVVNLVSVRPTATHQGRALVEYGSFNTSRGLVEATGPISTTLGYAFSAEGLNSQGFSALTDKGSKGDPHNHENDAWRRGNVDGRIEWKPGADLTVYAAARNVISRSEYDDAFSANFDDANLYQVDRLQRVSLGAEGRAGPRSAGAAQRDLWYAFDAAITTTEHQYAGSPYDNRYAGDEQYVSARTRWFGFGDVVVGGGIDWRRSALRYTANDDFGNFHAQDGNTGVYAQLSWSDALNELTGTLREDFHSREGDATTWRLGAARWAWDKRAKLHASVATGFRAPSVYELYAPDYFGSPIGNASLTPQRNVSYDAGHETELAPGLSLSNVYFRTEWTSAIAYDWTKGYYNAPGGRWVQGVENALDFQPAGDPLRLRLFWTLQESNDGTGQEVLHTPRQSGGAVAGWRWTRAAFDLTVRHVGARYASDGNQNRLDSYTTVAARISWQIKTWLELSLRGENLTDARYVPQRTSNGNEFTHTPPAVFAAVAATW